MKYPLPRAGIALSLLLACGVCAAQMRVEVIPLNHRMAEDVIPVVRPLLAPGGSVSGMHSNLVVKTTPENLVEIRTILDSIDRALRRLRISVRQDTRAFHSGTGHGVSGRVEEGNVTIRQGGRTGADGLTVRLGDEDDHVRYNTQTREAAATDAGTYHVQAIEGQPAFIQSGQAVPIPQRTVTAPHGGVVINDSVEYYNADSGFWVLPRLHGDQVTLLISPYTTRVGPGPVPAFDVQSAETTVSGRLGQWIPIGGISQSSTRTNKELLARESLQSSEMKSVEVRVDEIP
jgi:type II secretory pathway component GspD/PulD (secretin)